MVQASLKLLEISTNHITDLEVRLVPSINNIINNTHVGTNGQTNLEENKRSYEKWFTNFYLYRISSHVISNTIVPFY